MTAPHGRHLRNRADELDQDRDRATNRFLTVGLGGAGGCALFRGGAVAGGGGTGDVATAAILTGFGFLVDPFVYLSHEMAWDYMTTRRQLRMDAAVAA